MQKIFDILGVTITSQEVIGAVILAAIVVLVVVLALLLCGGRVDSHRAKTMEVRAVKGRSSK